MKLIMVTQRVERWEGIGERRDALAQDWAELADACGFLLLPIPNHRVLAERLLQKLPVDGIVLTGGNDLVSYGGDAPERDETERFLLGYALEHRLPLLGVCRGMQLILDYFGTALQPVEGHVRVEHTLDDGSVVNSFHGWGAVRCKPPLNVRARSADGVVEAVCHGEGSPIHGIMWHPERYRPFRETDLAWIRSVFEL